MRLRRWQRATRPQYCARSFEGIVPPDGAALLEMAPYHVRLAERNVAAAAFRAAAAGGDGGGDVDDDARAEFALETFDIHGPQVEQALLHLSKKVRLTNSSDTSKVSVACVYCVLSHVEIKSHSPESLRVSNVSIPTGAVFTAAQLGAMLEKKESEEKEEAEKKAAKKAAVEQRKREAAAKKAAVEQRKREAEEKKAATQALKERRREEHAKSEGERAAKRTKRDAIGAAAASAAAEPKPKRKTEQPAEEEEDVSEMQKRRKQVCLVCSAMEMLTRCVVSQNKDRRAALALNLVTQGQHTHF